MSAKIVLVKFYITIEIKHYHTLPCVTYLLWLCTILGSVGFVNNKKHFLKLQRGLPLFWTSKHIIHTIAIYSTICELIISVIKHNITICNRTYAICNEQYAIGRAEKLPFPYLGFVRFREFGFWGYPRVLSAKSRDWLRTLGIGCARP